MNKLTARPLVITWLNGVMWLHLVMGFGVSWFAGNAVFSNYHSQVLSAFHFNVANPEFELHLWWLNLFGATFQAFSAVTLLLIYLQKQHPVSRVWVLMALIIVGWAIQDIAISARINLVVHYLVDTVAVLILVPPFLYLAVVDAKGVNHVK